MIELIDPDESIPCNPFEEMPKLWEQVGILSARVHELEELLFDFVEVTDDD